MQFLRVLGQKILCFPGQSSLLKFSSKISSTNTIQYSCPEVNIPKAELDWKFLSDPLEQDRIKEGVYISFYFNIIVFYDPDG